MEFSSFSGGPRRNRKVIVAGQFFSSRGKIGVLHTTKLAKIRRKQRWRIRQRFGVWRGIKFVEKIRQTTVE